VKKIPTLFRRDPDNLRRLLPEVTPGCEWVLAGEGPARRKHDGVCVLILRDGLAVKACTRRAVKSGKAAPPRFQLVDYDPITDIQVGWEPVEQSGFLALVQEALTNGDDHDWLPGTYELCGPKVNGNPERYDTHRLIRHADAESYGVPPMLRPDGDTAMALAYLSGVVDGLAGRLWEGLVWHHPDGRMAKLKAKDFR